MSHLPTHPGIMWLSGISGENGFLDRALYKFIYLYSARYLLLLLLLLLLLWRWRPGLPVGQHYQPIALLGAVLLLSLVMPVVFSRISQLITISSILRRTSSRLDNITDFHHTHDTGAVTRILYELQAVWLLILPCVCILWKAIACMYVIVSIKRITIPGGRL